MNLGVPWNAGNFLTSCKPVSFSRRILHHGVIKYVSFGSCGRHTEHFSLCFSAVVLVNDCSVVSIRPSSFLCRVYRKKNINLCLVCAVRSGPNFEVSVCNQKCWPQIIYHWILYLHLQWGQFRFNCTRLPPLFHIVSATVDVFIMWWDKSVPSAIAVRLIPPRDKRMCHVNVFSGLSSWVSSVFFGITRQQGSTLMSNKILPFRYVLSRSRKLWRTIRHSLILFAVTSLYPTFSLLMIWLWRLHVFVTCSHCYRGINVGVVRG